MLLYLFTKLTLFQCFALNKLKIIFLGKNIPHLTIMHKNLLYSEKFVELPYSKFFPNKANI